jgi:hypothetical protein
MLTLSNSLVPVICDNRPFPGLFVHGIRQPHLHWSLQNSPTCKQGQAFRPWTLPQVFLQEHSICNLNHTQHEKHNNNNKTHYMAAYSNYELGQLKQLSRFRRFV